MYIAHIQLHYLRTYFWVGIKLYNQLNNGTVKPFNLAALNFSVLPSVDILAAL